MESGYNLDVLSLFTPGQQSFGPPSLDDEVGLLDASIPLSLVLTANGLV